MGEFGSGIEVVEQRDLAGDGGTEGIFGVEHLAASTGPRPDADDCGFCCCCRSIFCCCLNLESWKKSPKMALRSPLAMSPALTSPTVTPWSARKSKQAWIFGWWGFFLIAAAVMIPGTRFPVTASTTSASRRPSVSSVRKSRILPAPLAPAVPAPPAQPATRFVGSLSK